MRIARILIAVLSVAVLAGCSADGAAPNSGGGGGGGGDVLESLPDPCTWGTKEEAATAVGASVSDGFVEGVSTPALGSGRVCRFESAGTGDGEASIGVWPSVGELYETYKEGQKMFGNVKDLPGLGDKAFMVGNGEVTVIKGEYLIEINVFPANFDTDPTDRTIAFATSVVGRL